MKVRLETDANLTDTEIIIRAPGDTAEAQHIKAMLASVLSANASWPFYHGATKYYLPLTEILFFETQGRQINAHTVNDVYVTKLRLYELEEQLPQAFIRISKSTIINVEQVLAITRSISTCLVEFRETHKQVYASRRYYKQLQSRLNEMR